MKVKRKQLENIAPIKTKRKGYVITVQYLDDYIILDVFKDGDYCGRQCINHITGEYEQFDKKSWSRRKLCNLLGIKPDVYCSNLYKSDAKFASKEDEGIINNLFKHVYGSCALDKLDSVETKYAWNKRQQAEENRVDSINRLMSKVKELPQGIDEWIHKITGAEDFAFYIKSKAEYSCTACGAFFEETKAKRVDKGAKVRHNDMIICPECRKHIQVKKRTDNQKRVTSFAILQKIDDEISVYRSFDVLFSWYWNTRKTKLSEAARIIMYKNKKNVLYNGIYSFGYFNREITDPREKLIIDRQKFDNKHNYGQRCINAQILYPGGIEEALEGRHTEITAGIIKKMAADGYKIPYHKIIAATDSEVINAFEYIYKNRFYKLLNEFVNKISLDSGYYGALNIYNGKNINEVFGLKDTQKIHRLRDINGGELELAWLQYSEQHNMKITDKVLKFMQNNDVYPKDFSMLLKHMSAEQTVNYITRQQSESYKGKTVREILSQYADYISMCVRLHKNIDDEMIYRPRNLKQRHDEAVIAIERDRIIKDMNMNMEQREAEAENMRQKYPGCEEILREIKAKYEYANDEYMMIIPDSLMQIVQEGAALHHCVGSSDRYFDRIRSNETYIAFLRRREDAQVPFYTIEFEPGGTVRQHRSRYDEEPGIELIRGFLKEWQKEIKKRLKDKDLEMAKTSAIKRSQNIKELEQQRNTRVLKALEEDFLEAI